MKEKYTWQTKYVWYVVTDEGRLVHPEKRTHYGYRCETLDWPYDSEVEAVEALEKFYHSSDYVTDDHVLQKVYVKTCRI